MPLSATEISVLKIKFAHLLGDDRVAIARLRMPWSRSTRLTLNTLIPNRWATCELVAPEMYRSITA